MTRLTSLLAAMVLAVAACSGGDGEAAANPPDAESADEAAAGEAASADEAFTYFDGRKGTLADYEGRPLVVNFFAAWCVPCVKEMPAFEEVYQELGDEIAFLGFDVRDQLEDGKRIAEQTGVTYDLARDPDGGFLTLMGGVVMPTTALIDERGEVVEVHSGALEADALRDLIDEHLRT